MNKGIKILVSLVLLGVSVALVYLTYKSVSGPVEFDKEQAKRERVLQQKLKKIVAFEEAYQERYGKFANMEELVSFLKADSIFSVKAEGEYTSEMRDKGLTEEELAAEGNELFDLSKELLLAKVDKSNSSSSKGRRVSVSLRRQANKIVSDVYKSLSAELAADESKAVELVQTKGTELLMAAVLKENLLIRDTIWSPASVLLSEDQTVETSFEVPVFGKTEKSTILVEVATIPQIVGLDTIQSPVFQASVPLATYLSDLDENRLRDKIALMKERRDGKGFAGLRIGSLEEIKTTGNWE